MNKISNRVVGCRLMMLNRQKRRNALLRCASSNRSNSSHRRCNKRRSTLGIEIVTMIVTQLLVMKVGDITLHPTRRQGKIRPIKGYSPDKQQQYYQQLAHIDYKDRLKIEN